jgi:hypothetical protein
LEEWSPPDLVLPEPLLTKPLGEDRLSAFRFHVHAPRPISRSAGGDGGGSNYTVNTDSRFCWLRKSQWR